MTAATAIAIQRAGAVTSVGLSAPASCAAIRAKVANPTQTRFLNSSGQRIFGHEVPLEYPWRGLAKLLRMAAMATDECLSGLAKEGSGEIPVLLCVAEKERPGRLRELDDRLLPDLEQALEASFSRHSRVVPFGRASVAPALQYARTLLYDEGVNQVLVVAADSLLSWPALSHYELSRRLLTGRNSNGFIAGEGACTLLLGRAGRGAGLTCTGIGVDTEPASIDSNEPLRADGLSRAIQKALADAGCEIHEIDFRLSDVAGEQYYFKEAALAVTRLMRTRKPQFDIWHPAECTGETGAVAGALLVALSYEACRKGYAPGPRMLAHMSNDAGQRAALVLTFGGSARG